MNVRHSTDSADGLNYAIDRHFSTQCHRKAGRHVNGDMLRKESRLSATFQIIPPGKRWAWGANSKGAQPKWSALLAPAIRENHTYVESRGLRKRDDDAVEDTSVDKLEHEVVSGFFVALRGHCDRFGPPSKRMRSTADADDPAPASGPAPAPESAVPRPPSAIPTAMPPPTSPPATPPAPPVAIESQPAQPPPAPVHNHRS